MDTVYRISVRTNHHAVLGYSRENMTWAQAIRLSEAFMFSVKPLFRGLEAKVIEIEQDGRLFRRWVKGDDSEWKLWM